MSARSTTAGTEAFEATLRIFERRSGRGKHEALPADDSQPTFDKASIASLSPDQIDNMGPAELVCVIRATQIPFIRSDVETHLKQCDRFTLRRLAYLARRMCRNQGY